MSTQDDRDERDDRDFERYRWLSAITDDLSPAAQEIWHGLHQKFGNREEDHLDRLWWVKGASVLQERSPVSEETLGGWSVDEVVRYCSAYTGPEESFDRDSKAGLADAIVDEVQRRPGDFAGHALEFKSFARDNLIEENPRYVMALFRGLQLRIKAVQVDDPGILMVLTEVLADPVMELILWMKDRESDARGRDVPTWESARREVSEFLLASLERVSQLPAQDIGSILVPRQHKIFEGLRALQNAEDPSDEVDAVDPLLRCVNSTRGRALLAVVALQIAWDVWNQSNTPQQNSPDCLLQHIASFFEDRLEKERSPAVRCVFGWRLPHLHRLAPAWVTNHIGEIFPLDEVNRSIWRASWDAYVVFNRLYTSLWSLLKPYYASASVQIAQSEGSSKGQGDPDERLAEHIFLAWFTGLEDAESALASLIAASEDDLRSRLVWFGSRVLESNVASEGLSAASEEWEKLERFWNERVNQLGVLGETPCGMKEAAGFVHWLRWTPAELPRLKPLILGLISRLADREQIWETTRLVEYLCDQSTSYPLEAAQLMAALVEVTWPQWLNGEQKQAVISTLLRARGQRGGEALVNHIVEEMARRHEYEYRQVLTEQGTGE